MEVYFLVVYRYLECWWLSSTTRLKWGRSLGLYDTRRLCPAKNDISVYIYIYTWNSVTFMYWCVYLLLVVRRRKYHEEMGKRSTNWKNRFCVSVSLLRRMISRGLYAVWIVLIWWPKRSEWYNWKIPLDYTGLPLSRLIISVLVFAICFFCPSAMRIEGLQFIGTVFQSIDDGEFICLLFSSDSDRYLMDHTIEILEFLLNETKNHTKI